MALSQKEKKRRSRASKSKEYHDMEREASRKRMAIYRAKNKAQKRASQLRSLLGPEDDAAVDGHVARHRQLLVSDWFSYRGLRFRPRMLREPAVLRGVMSKIEMHKIELRVAEFEISIIEDWDNDEGEDGEGAISFVPSARLELDRRPGCDSVTPRILARAKGAKGWLEQLEPDAVTSRDWPVQDRAKMDASSAEAMSGSGSKSEPALSLHTQTIARTGQPSRKYDQTFCLSSVDEQEVPAQTNQPSCKYSKALGLPFAEEQEVLSNNETDCLITKAMAPVVSDGEEASEDGDHKYSKARCLPYSEEQEVLSNNDTDHQIPQAATPVASNAEEASADGEAAVATPVPPPPYVAEAPPSHVLRSLTRLPSLARGRCVDKVARSEEGIHRAVAEAMKIYHVLPRPTARRQAREEEQFLFDASVDRAVAAAMAQLFRGEPLRRRTVAPPSGVEGPVVRAEDVRSRATDPSLGGAEGPVERVRDLRPHPLAGGIEGPCESEEVPEDWFVTEVMQLLGEGPAECAEDARSVVPYKSEEAEALRPPDNQEVIEAMRPPNEEAPVDRDVTEPLCPPENNEVTEAMQFFMEGILGDVPPEQGTVDEAQVPQDELLRMDMECFDIGDNGLHGLESNGIGVGGIDEESFSAKAFHW